MRCSNQVGLARCLTEDPCSCPCRGLEKGYCPTSTWLKIGMGSLLWKAEYSPEPGISASLGLELEGIDWLCNVCAYDLPRTQGHSGESSPHSRGST